MKIGSLSRRKVKEKKLRSLKQSLLHALDANYSLDIAELNSAMVAIKKTSDPEKGRSVCEEHPNTWIYYRMNVNARHLLRLR